MIGTNIARFDDCAYSLINYTSIDIFGHDNIKIAAYSDLDMFCKASNIHSTEIKLIQ